MEILIVGIAVFGNAVLTLVDLIEDAMERLYKRTHNKRNWNEHGSWIVRKEI